MNLTHNLPTPQPLFLKDYRETPYRLLEVSLNFKLDPQATRVTSRLSFEPRDQSSAQVFPLDLQGEKFTLVSFLIDDQQLTPDRYEINETSFRLFDPPQRLFSLTIETICDPLHNTALTGLYQSNGVFCTQCEAEGFRRITYFYDRPDVMAIYTVRLEADAKLHPVLLSNGNLVSQGQLPAGRHFAVWHDPHPKPSYLFALVAGNLEHISDEFITASGRRVTLGIYVEPGKQDRCAWAMQCLKESMRWDEQRFGREYDLDVFNIVAISDFNMGAMENKGLNIFNDKYILALPETATDLDYVLIEAVIAHEYFHNWTGNRITCRDWFQLCLKEGLTVFRDQEFSSDLRSRAVKRITDVKTLRARQFPEDAGPLSHPVRPTSYIEINNFYTATVYEKGAEICRMLLTLVGREKFRQAMDLYFQRFDGTAATVEDFISCMAAASGRDLSHFFKWYEQAGTPRINVESSYDANQKNYKLTLSQSFSTTAPTLPLHIPLRLGLLGRNGQDLPLQTMGSPAIQGDVIELTQTSQSFIFTSVPEAPVLSLNRGFSAPVIVEQQVSEAELLFLMQHDSDPFNRWEAAQSLGRVLIAQMMHHVEGNGEEPDCTGFVTALRHSLENTHLDDEFKALLLNFPTEAEIAALQAKEVDTDVVHQARTLMSRQVSSGLAPLLVDIWQRTLEAGPYSPAPADTGRRALHFSSLHLLSTCDPEQSIAMMQRALSNPQNMSVEYGTLNAMISLKDPAIETQLEAFYTRHRDDHLLVNKWFALNALIPCEGSAARIAKMIQHPAFKLTNPSRVFALLASFTAMNISGFNSSDGQGYRVVADAVAELDKINPQVAARVATGFRSWQIMNEPRRKAAKKVLSDLSNSPSISSDLFEIINKTLGHRES